MHGVLVSRLCCAAWDRMPQDEDDDLSFLRALADDLILDVAERDLARVARAIVDVCERLAAERHIPRQELEAAIDALLLEWQERLSERRRLGRPDREPT